MRVLTRLVEDLPMLKQTRIVAMGVLTLAVGLAGCGKSDEGTQAKTEPKTTPQQQTPETPKPANPPTASPTTPQEPPRPADPWELDVAKHTIPEKPVEGKIVNKAFKPEVTIIGNVLTFEVENEDKTRTDVAIKLPASVVSGADKGSTLKVEAKAAAGTVPEVTLTVPGMPNPVQYPYTEGYALTLELGKKQKGQVAGKVYLVLPETEHNKDRHKSYLAGTFTTEWQRSPDVLPGSDDVPYVQGKIAVEGKSEPTVKIGCIGAQPDAAGTFLNESVETTLLGKGVFSRFKSAALFSDDNGKGRYEFIHLPPGKYFVYVLVPGGPAFSKWVTIDDNTADTLDVTLKESKPGTLEVTLPETVTGKVSIAPSDEKLTGAIAATIAFSMGYTSVSKDDKVAKFENLPAGKYDVWAVEKLGTIEVKPGETAKLDTKK